MLTLERNIILNDEAIASPNLCDRFEEADLKAIGSHVWEGYDRDRRSRSKWEKRTQAAMDLAMQVQKDKTFPWPGASNVAFPLITIGALQFHSRAYPAIISGNKPVNMKVVGEDPSGEKTRRANRISTYMSWQCLEEDRAWEEQKDRLLINLPIVGTCFSKSYYDSERDHKVDETVLAQDLVVNYWAKSVETCPRKTHIIPFFRNDIHSRIKRKTFRDVSLESWYQQAPVPKMDMNSAAKDNRQGVTPSQGDETTPFVGLEQHVQLDLDGDGYAEPYIITIEESSRSVLRIVTGFDTPDAIERTKSGEIISIRAMQYFTKYDFIPSPDGGIYGVGFGVLIGPLNESVNTLVNQLTDAGTMQNTKGGFLGKGAKVRGGVYTFAPLEWKRVDSSGDDLRKNIVPLEVGEPSSTLFNLLNLLISYVNRLAGTTDPQVGEPVGQNTPAETSRTMVQEGQRIYSAVFKRIWRAMKEEFKKDFIINGLYMPRRKSFGQGLIVLREDFLANPDEVTPSADPNITSDSMMITQAQMLKQSAMSTPGYNMDEVERRYLKAIKVDNIDVLFPGVAKTGAPKDVKLQIAELKHQGDQAWLAFEQAKTAAELMQAQRMLSAEIAKIEAEISIMQQDSAGDVEDRKINAMNTALGFLKAHDESLRSKIELMLSAMELAHEQREAALDRRGVGGVAAAPSNAGPLAAPVSRA